MKEYKSITVSNDNAQYYNLFDVMVEPIAASEENKSFRVRVIIEKNVKNFSTLLESGIAFNVLSNDDYQIIVNWDQVFGVD